MMGGSGAHEYMAPCAAGENEVALAPGYAANVEVASAEAQPVELPPALDEPREVPTPGLTTVAEVAGALGVPEGAALKAIPVVAAERGFLLTLVRGDHRLNEIKLGERARRRRSPGDGRGDRRPSSGRPGFIGPVGAERARDQGRRDPGRGLLLRRQPPRRAPDRGRARARLQLRGARHPHGRGRRPRARRASRSRSSPRSRSATSSSSAPATRSRSARPTWTRRASERPIVMGSYGIGPARIVAAAIEQGADERGIVWPPSIAPWQVHVVGLGKAGTRTGRRGRAHLRGARKRGRRGTARRSRRRARGRSSPTPSCWAAPCGSRSASAPSPRARWRRRRAAAARRRASVARRPPSACAELLAELD